MTLLADSERGLAAARHDQEPSVFRLYDIVSDNDLREAAQKLAIRRRSSARRDPVCDRSRPDGQALAD